MFRTIFLEKWVPALITAGVGGVLVAFIVPGIQSHYAGESALKQRRLELWESIGSNFTRFTNANFQLVSAAREAEGFGKKGKEAPESLVRRMENYRIDRDRYASQLNEDLILAPFYFGKPVTKLVGDYRAWITTHATATADTMPPRAEFDAWRDRFMYQIRALLDSE